MPPISPEFYSGTAAADIVGLTRANLAEATKDGRIMPDALIATETKTQPAFLRETLENYRTGAPTKKRPQKLYSISGAFTYCGMSSVQFRRKRRQQPIPHTALLHRSPGSEPQELYTRKDLNAWMKVLTTSAPKPRTLEVYPHDQAAVFLGIAPGKFDELLREHPLAPDVMIIDPAGPGWFDATLRAYRSQHAVHLEDAS